MKPPKNLTGSNRFYLIALGLFFTFLAMILVVVRPDSAEDIKFFIGLFDAIVGLGIGADTAKRMGSDR